jgi:hypothetical protein
MRPLSLRNKMNNPSSVLDVSGVHLNGNHLKAIERKS